MSTALTRQTPREAHRRILAIAIPAILANSSAPLVGLVDTWAIGHLGKATDLAAVGLGSVIFSYLFWAFGFLRMGTTGLVAQALGRNDREAMARTVVRSGALSLLLGLALCALQWPLLKASLGLMGAPDAVAAATGTYFHIRIWAAPATLWMYAVSGVLFGLGRTRAVLALQLVLNLSNMVFNLCFVVGLDMGVAGVALGTLLAQCLAAGIGAWMLARAPGLERLRPAVTEPASWSLAGFRALASLNGWIFLRTIFLMSALALIMKEAARHGTVAMAASHVVNQYLLLMALGLDGFAHAAEALSGAAWGAGRVAAFRRWVRLTGCWALAASLVYALVFFAGGNALTALLTDIDAVREAVAELMPLVVALPVIAVWCFHFDGVFIGATAARAMMVTMGIAFAGYLAVLSALSQAMGLTGIWLSVLLFMGLRGAAQAAWYPRLLALLRGRSANLRTG